MKSVMAKGGGRAWQWQDAKHYAAILPYGHLELFFISGFREFDLFLMTYKGGHWTAIAVVYNGYKTKIYM